MAKKPQTICSHSMYIQADLLLPVPVGSNRRTVIAHKFENHESTMSVYGGKGVMGTTVLYVL